nr:hypothetical protein [uncultured Tolumonas sp.]
MWYAEPPVNNNEEQAAIYIADKRASNPQEFSKQKLAVGECVNIPLYADGSSFNADHPYELFPISSARTYMLRYKDTDIFSTSKNITETGVTVLKQPQHGKIVMSSLDDPYGYYPDQDYEGDDYFVLDVQKGDIKIQIHYFVLVTIEVNSVCPQMPKDSDGIWKINLAFDDLSYQHSSILNETSTTGSSAKIDIAGYGWYIDYTPYLNGEYFPKHTIDVYRRHAKNYLTKN